jgi:hypothetical protein
VKQLLIAALVFALAIGSAAADEGVLVADVAEKALQQSQITLPGSNPFHLVATIVETTDPGSEPRATIEEYWISPDKWRRTIKSADFSQTRIVNGDAVSEQNTGDYFPAWLSQLITAVIDPLPMLNAIKQSNSRMQKPRADETCADFHMRIDRWVICFEGAHGLLTSIFTKGYSAEFKDFENFAGKRVPRRIVKELEPGTTLELRIDSLEVLQAPDESMFTISQPTPLSDQISRLVVSDETARTLIESSMEIAWPSVGGGILKGGCGIYISADRSGHVREAWPEGCDNPAMQGVLRDAVMKWQLKPAVLHGVPVQIESLMGFSYETTVDTAKTPPLLTDDEARKLATYSVQPKFPEGTPRPADFIAQITVDDTGKFISIQNTNRLDGPILQAIVAALRKWEFKPFIKDGQPQLFHADIIFHNN